MSSTSDLVQYNFDISAQQPDTGGELTIDFSLQQTADFSDTQASAMYTAMLATIPTGWSIFGGLSKVETDTTQWNWDSTAQAFQ